VPIRVGCDSAARGRVGVEHKEIGERLFLSHRTVGTHLYQIFPKLGISSRAALRDALEGYTADDQLAQRGVTDVPE
jgi:regulatory LuxR family protein